MFTSWELITMSFMNITNMVQNGAPLLGYQLSIPFTAHRTPVGLIADWPRPIAYMISQFFFLLTTSNFLKNRQGTNKTKFVFKVY